MGEGGEGGGGMTREDAEAQIQRMFAKAGIDIQAWPWWTWIDILVDHEMEKIARMNNAVKPTQEAPK